MPFQKEFEFPSDEELNVPEVKLSTSSLRAGAIHLGKYCEKQNNEFMLCKYELHDPRKCLKEGKDVTNCAIDFFKKMKQHCCKEFKQYANCLNRSSGEMQYKYCRNTQAILDQCILEKMNLERPPFGWQCETHIHHTDRPKPKEDIAYYPDAAVEFPHDEIKPGDPKYGVRSSYST